MDWLDYYKLAQEYYKNHKDLLIPTAFRTANGYEYNENGVKLGAWLQVQRKQFKQLSKDKQDFLYMIGFVENIHDAIWNRNYELAKKYCEFFGDLSIPTGFTTKNGYKYDENGVNLGTWMQTQRKQFPSLSNERKKLLKMIGYVENDIIDTWNRNYELAKKYYEYYGNLLIPTNFKTINGYEYDENGISIGIWIKAQRLLYQNLSEERQILLNKIGFVHNAILGKSKELWKKYYLLVKNYYFYYKNLAIPSRFTTIDGINYDENGLSIGKWLSTQRINLNPESEEGQLLSEIGMDWIGNEYSYKELCEQYGIDFIKNKKILKSNTILELKAKIDYLLEKNNMLVDENGIVNDIFRSNSQQMQERYGISLEEIINNYCVKLINNNRKQ